MMREGAWREQEEEEREKEKAETVARTERDR